MSTFSATWQAAWYELDQPIKIGLTDGFWFTNEKGQKKFFAGLLPNNNIEKITGAITSTTHKYLGSISEIHTVGLTYKIVLSSGKEIIIEAEETPGQIENDFPAFETDDYIFDVTISTK
jgi:hypothetical protein